MNNQTRRACRLAAALAGLGMFLPLASAPAAVAPLSRPKNPTTVAHKQMELPLVAATTTGLAPVAPPAVVIVVRSILADVHVATQPSEPATASSLPVAPVAPIHVEGVAMVAVEPAVDVRRVNGPNVYVDNNAKRERSPGVDVEWAVYLGDDVAMGAQHGKTPFILRADGAAEAVLIVGILRKGKDKGGPRYAIPVEYAYEVKDVPPVAKKMGKVELMDDAVNDDGEADNSDVECAA